LSSTFIPLCIPTMGDLEKRYVQEAIEIGWVSSVGPHVNQFEKNLSKRLGNKTIACSSGTSALHLALIVAGVKENDEVLIPNITFVATANAVAYIGANPICLDIDKDDLCLSPRSIEVFIEKYCELKDGTLINKNSRNRVSAIIPVHIIGTPSKMNEINLIAKKYNLKVVEDSTEALGSYIDDQPVGTFGDFGCFSFNGNKIITTGGGGAVTAKRIEDVEKMKHLSTTAKTDEIFFSHDEIGFNYRMVNLVAAFGVAQLERLDEILAKKTFIHNCYKKLLAKVNSVELFTPPENVVSNFWMNAISSKKNHSSDLRYIVEKFNQKNIQVRPFWTLIDTLGLYHQPQNISLSNSYDIYNSTILLPSSFDLSEKEIEYVVKQIIEIYD